MNTTALKKEYKGNVGLFLVCLEISKKNLIALPTSRNTRGLDLIVLHPDTNKAVGLKVKCSDQKKRKFWRRIGITTRKQCKRK